MLGYLLLEFSDEHSFLVANIRNLRTGCIRSQFHSFDDICFDDICFDEDDMMCDAICLKMIEIYMLKLILMLKEKQSTLHL